jgi:late competence protein required for DNA uptake (superfamily II DNA/RNA helicase)
MKCHRTACESNHNVVCRHTQTGSLYCPSCARIINSHNPGLIDWPPVEEFDKHRGVREWHREGDRYIGQLPDGSVVTVQRVPAAV